MSQEVHKKICFRMVASLKFLKCFVVLTFWKQRKKMLCDIINIQN